MLRADAEMRCLSRDVIPVLRDVERREQERRDEQGRELERREDLSPERSAAIAYLEVLWVEAEQRALATEAAFEEAARGRATGDDEGLSGKAQRLHEAVARLRDGTARRVEPQLVAEANARMRLSRVAAAAPSDASAAPDASTALR